MKRIIPLSLSIAAYAACAAEPELKPVKIDQTGWGGGASAADAQRVVNSVARTFLKHGGVAADAPILVYQNENPHPVALTKPAPGGERVIKLATSGPYWSQLTYQFSHEYCHTFTKHWELPLDHKNMWFAESLCELASLWCLVQMGDDWLAGGAPYSYWNNYGATMKEYVADHVKNTPTFESAAKFSEWLLPKLNDFYKDGENRNRNRVVAVRLLPLFLKEPSLWAATPYLNSGAGYDADFQTHLLQWHDAVPENLRASVVKIAAELGFGVETGEKGEATRSRR